MHRQSPSPVIDVIIPAYNEEKSIGRVIADIPGFVSEIIVVDNGSSDGTAAVAREAGATVLRELNRGYGSACLKAIAHCNEKALPPDVIVFIDGDYSDFPEQMPDLVKPIVEHGNDLVIGSRNLGNREVGSMTIQQIFGNWLATSLLRLLFDARFTDLGPFRAIRFSALLALGMRDRNFGWTVEMQVKAAKQKLKCVEVPVHYRKRIGISKVSGTVSGTVRAGYKILYTIFKYI